MRHGVGLAVEASDASDQGLCPLVIWRDCREFSLETLGLRNAALCGSKQKFGKKEQSVHFQ